MTLHANRGAPMTSKNVTQRLVGLGVKRSHLRPQVSNDNPCSEAQFDTFRSAAPRSLRSSTRGRRLAMKKRPKRSIRLELPGGKRQLAELTPEERDWLWQALLEAERTLSGPVRLDLCAVGQDAPAPHAPGAVARLTTGGDDRPLLAQVRALLSQSERVDVLSAFVMTSGVDLIEPLLRSALERGARLRLLTGDYLGHTHPAALSRLLELAHQTQLRDDPDEASAEAWSGELALRVVEMATLAPAIPTFHPKAWIFRAGERAWALVGSSNLSRAALTRGVEWNLALSQTEDPHGFNDIVRSFERLWSRGTPVTRAWIADYARRVRSSAPPRQVAQQEDAEAPEPLPEPRRLQRLALEALQAHRARGHRRGLVVMATGLGKTWLAAFDVRAFEAALGRAPRVLLVAHRVELLRQAADTFHKIDPERPIGYCAGPFDELDQPVVVASVQKLTRREHLSRLAPGAFDYVIIDEVHHAAAPTYEQLIEHLEPAFLLGLTATPERGDDVHIAGLFGGRVVFEAGLGEGIEGGELVPFRYFGLRDVVDYAPIPWRSGRFDLARLERAVQTRARMERLWEAWQRHRGERTLVFCCSIVHATFVARWLSERGLRVVAVHSGDGSSDRVASIEALERGELDVVCTVDLFNEGVDIPSVDRVVMLRPTGSRVVFLQQLGRGLRTAPDKQDLVVIDFVGNHRVFLDRVRALLDLGSERVASIRQLIAGRAAEALPEGCSVDIELEAIALLEKLLPAATSTRLLAAYRRLRDHLGRRPRPAELHAEGYNPASVREHTGGWFHLANEEGDLSPTEQRTLAMTCSWFEALERLPLAAASLVVLEQWLEALDERLVVPLDRLEDATEEALEPLVDRLPGLRRADDLLALTRPLELPRLPTWRAMNLELVEYLQLRRRRLDQQNSASAPGQRGFTAKVIHNKRHPIIKLPGRKHHPNMPRGEVDVRLPDGAIWRLRMVKDACTVARPFGAADNQLPNLLRRWFGPDAGRPGTNFHVRFEPTPDGWLVRPDGAHEVAASGSRGEVFSFPTLRAAAGWDRTASPAASPATLTLPLSWEASGRGEDVFAVRVSGDSMDAPGGLQDGDWAIMRWRRNARLSELVGHVALVARGEGQASYHIKRIQGRDGAVWLDSDAEHVPSMPAEPGDEVIATLLERVPPETLAPAQDCVMSVAEITERFGLTRSLDGAVVRDAGHLLLLLDDPGTLLAPDLVAPLTEPATPGETANVFAKAEESDTWRFLGVGRHRQARGGWVIPEVDFLTWRAHGEGRSASRELPETWREAAEAFVETLLEARGEGGVVEALGRRCRLLERSERGGVRIDGGPDGFKPRTVSLLDIGWVLLARDDAAQRGLPLVDERRVNELRYLRGTPRTSTRYIDTRWALVLTAASGR